MKNEEFTIKKEKIPGGLRFIIRGRVNSINAPGIQHKLDEAIKDGEKKIVLDMGLVEFLSSAGIRVILKTHKDITKAGGTFGIEQASESVKNVLGMVALGEMLL